MKLETRQQCQDEHDALIQAMAIVVKAKREVEAEEADGVATWRIDPCGHDVLIDIRYHLNCRMHELIDAETRLVDKEATDGN